MALHNDGEGIKAKDPPPEPWLRKSVGSLTLPISVTQGQTDSNPVGYPNTFVIFIKAK